MRVDNRAGTVLGKSSKLSGLELNEPADVQCDGLQLSAFGDESTSPTHMGVSENRGTLFWSPYNKDPTI